MWGLLSGVGAQLPVSNGTSGKLRDGFSRGSPVADGAYRVARWT